MSYTDRNTIPSLSNVSILFILSAFELQIGLCSRSPFVFKTPVPSESILQFFPSSRNIPPHTTKQNSNLTSSNPPAHHTHTYPNNIIPPPTKATSNCNFRPSGVTSSALSQPIYTAVLPLSEYRRWLSSPDTRQAHPTSMPLVWAPYRLSSVPFSMCLLQTRHAHLATTPPPPSNPTTNSSNIPAHLTSPPTRHAQMPLNWKP